MEMFRYLLAGSFLFLIQASLVAADGANSELRSLLVSATEAMQREQLQEAERLFEEARERYPDSRDARFGLGTLYIKQGNYAAAIDIMQGLKRDFPGQFPIINNLAWLYATATDHSVRDGARAIALAQEALLLQPNNYHVWSTLSEGHYVVGDYERALRTAREALRLSREADAPADRIRDYQEQVEKSRRAAEAMTILE